MNNNSKRPVIHDAEIIDIHYSGNHYFIHNNKKYYVSKVLIGEIVDVQVLNKRVGYRMACAVNFILKSDKRIIPCCEYYNFCESCNFLHIQYDEQLDLKKKNIQKAFDKYNVELNCLEVKPSINKLNYRNNASYKICNNNKYYSTGFIYNKKLFIEIKNCKILKNEINQLNEIVCKWINENKVSSYDSFSIRTNTDGLSIIIFYTQNSMNIEIFESLKKYFAGIYVKNANSFNIIYETAEYYEKISGISFKVHPLTFFQNNIQVAEEVISYINQNLTLKNKVVYDLYCGNGSISLILLHCQNFKVYGIDNNSFAVADANFNAKSMGKENLCNYINGDVLETFNQDFIKKLENPDVIILDPPRFGTLIEILKNIVQSKAKYIVYVSCNPVSLAWNLSLIKNHYKIINIKAFDMFPQTHHVETVAILERII